MKDQEFKREQDTLRQAERAHHQFAAKRERLSIRADAKPKGPFKPKPSQVRQAGKSRGHEVILELAKARGCPVTLMFRDVDTTTIVDKVTDFDKFTVTVQIEGETAVYFKHALIGFALHATRED